MSYEWWVHGIRIANLFLRLFLFLFQDSDPGSVIRLCLLNKRKTKMLLKDQDLSKEDMEDLDFTDVDMTTLKFKGKCIRCPEADPVDKAADNPNSLES